MIAGRGFRSGEVALWRIAREGAHRDPAAERAALDAASLARLEASSTPAARDAQLLSRAWLTHALRACFGAESADWQVGIDCNGRATLRGAPPAIRVAFAHGQRASVFAIGRECGPAIGIDLEDRLESDDPLLAQTMLSQRELRRYHGIASGKARARYLLRQWAAKEAYAKALGTGLSLPFERLDIVQRDGDGFAVDDPFSPGPQWGGWLWEQPGDHSAIALALVQPVATTRPELISIGFERAG